MRNNQCDMVESKQHVSVCQHEQHPSIGWVLLTLGCVLMCGSTACGDDKTVRAAFRAQYEPHADKLQKFYYANIRAKGVETQDLRNDRQYITTLDVRCNRSNYILTYSTKLIDKKNDKTSGGNNSQTEGNNYRYGFELTRKGEGGYAIGSVMIHSPGKSSAPCFLSVPVAGCLYGKKTFLEMTDDESIRFLEFEECV